MATLVTFSETGFESALIQKKKNIESYLDVAWTILIIRGFVLFILLYLISPYAAIFFNAPEAESIIKVIGLSLLLQAFKNIGIIYFMKELEFRKQFVYQFSGVFADFIVAVSSVFIFRNVWAIVFGLLAGNLALLVVSYIIHPYRPHLSLDIKKTRELNNYGKWIFGSSILGFMLTQGDDIIVGKILGINALGFYQMAYKISNMPSTEIANILMNITLSLYSKLQDEIQVLKETFLKILQLTNFFSFPIAGLIFIMSSDFTMIFLGEKWMPMVAAIKVLVLWGVIRGMFGTMIPVFMAIGKPAIVTKLQTVQLILMFIFILPLTKKWDIVGASMAVFLSAFIMFFVRNHILIMTIKCRYYEFYKLTLFPLITTVVSMLFTFYFNLFFVYQSNIYYFVVSIGIFLMAYIFSNYIIDKYSNYGMWLILKESLNRFR